MIRDAHLVFSTAQRISANGDTAATDHIDTLAKGDAIKPGARFKVVSDEIMGGDLTKIEVQLMTKEGDATFGSGGTLLFTSGDIAKANTAAGTVLVDVVIPPGVKRYLGVNYKTDNTAGTSGKMSAYIVLDSDINADRAL